MAESGKEVLPRGTLLPLSITPNHRAVEAQLLRFELQTISTELHCAISATNHSAFASDRNHSGKQLFLPLRGPTAPAIFFLVL